MKNLNILGVGTCLLLLAACSTAPLPQSQEVISQIVTVPLEAKDTKASIESYYGAKILVWSDDSAVIGLENTDLFTVGSRKNSENQVIVEVLESNQASYAAGGKIASMNGSSAWAQGSRAWAQGSRAWAQGSRAWAQGSSAWAQGEFILMPENTVAWQQINLEKAQTMASHLGYGVKVAILDTGLDLNHPALVQGLTPQSDWKDFVDNDALPQEEGVLGEGGYGHGTNVAGIVRQIAPAAQIMPLRVLDKDGNGKLSDIAAAIVWAVDHGAKIINMSLGTDELSPALEAAISYATSKNVLIVSSVGNTGDSKVSYPASAADSSKDKFFRLNVTSVNANDSKSTFASFGTSVELAAPGENIFGPAPDLRVASWSGTSMAAPIATGALTLALGEAYNVQTKMLTQMLKVKSVDLYSSKNIEFQDLLGQGRIDISAYLEKVLP